MEVWRHISAGRLSELFGESQLDTDRFIRTLGWRVAAQRDLDAARPADPGRPRRLHGRGQRLARRPPRLAGAGLPGRGRHARAMDRPRHRRLGQGPGLEPRRQLRFGGLPLPGRCRARRPGPDRRAAAGLSGRRAGDHAIGPGRIGWSRRGRGRNTDDQRSRRAGERPHARGHRGPIGSRGGSRLARPSRASATGRSRWPASTPPAGLASDHGIGSNNWVVGAVAVRVSGGALLANDPHLGHLHAVDLVHERAPLPDGRPGLSLRRGWRLVPGRPRGRPRAQRTDRLGCHERRPRRPGPRPRDGRPDRPGRYLHEGASVPFETRPEEIRSRAASRSTLEVRSTIHGPILNGVDERLADAPR